MDVLLVHTHTLGNAPHTSLHPPACCRHCLPLDTLLTPTTERLAILGFHFTHHLTSHGGLHPLCVPPGVLDIAATLSSGTRQVYDTLSYLLQPLATIHPSSSSSLPFISAAPPKVLYHMGRCIIPGGGAVRNQLSAKKMPAVRNQLWSKAMPAVWLRSKAVPAVRSQLWSKKLPFPIRNKA
jgi:hypothetical protein